jgi:hypothetical protein
MSRVPRIVVFWPLSRCFTMTNSGSEREVRIKAIESFSFKFNFLLLAHRIFFFVYGYVIIKCRHPLLARDVSNFHILLELDPLTRFYESCSLAH